MGVIATSPRGGIVSRTAHSSFVAQQNQGVNVGLWPWQMCSGIWPVDDIYEWLCTFLERENITKIETQRDVVKSIAVCHNRILQIEKRIALHEEDYEVLGDPKFGTGCAYKAHSHYMDKLPKLWERLGVVPFRHIKDKSDEDDDDDLSMFEFK